MNASAKPVAFLNHLATPAVGLGTEGACDERATGEALRTDGRAEDRGERAGPRLAALEGRRAGVLDNGKAGAGTLMLAVVERLRQRHGVAEVLKREKAPAAVEFGELPRTSTGKVQKFVLREKEWGGRAKRIN